MGEPIDPGDWPDDDDLDWARLYALRPHLWYAMLRDLGQRPEPAALARFVDRCIISLRCLTDVHARLPAIGLTLAQFVELREAAWHAQFAAVTHDERPVADDEDIGGFGDDTRFKTGRLADDRAGWRPDLEEALADEMRRAVINLHLRGLTDDQVACALDIPADWPETIVRRARLNPKARTVIRAHLEGGTLAEIKRATGVPTTTTARILKLIGDQPNGAQSRINASDRNHNIRRLRAKGMSYKAIARRLNCSIDDVRNALRKDRQPDQRRRRGPAE